MANLLSAEKIQSNFNSFVSFCELTGDRAEPLLSLVKELESFLVFCPASGKKDYHLAIPGGLVDHSLRVLQNALALKKTYGWNVPKESLIISCLFHDIGKLGSYKDGKFLEYYVPQTSEWHRDKLGEMYTYNKELPYMTTRQRTLFLLQHFGVKLTHDEYLAILLNDGFFVEENKSYILKEPLLAHIVMTADYISTMQEKGMFT